jgi:NAD(P)H-flavin reductase
VNNSTSSAAHDPWLAQCARIQRIISETHGVATYDLVFDNEAAGESFSFLPGQFNMIYLPGIGEIAISISGDPNISGVVPHTIREAGSVTQALAGLGVGGSVGLRGPFGTGWPVDRCAGKDIVLAAGGIGIAPLRPVIYEILANRDRFGEVTLLYGCRMPSGILYEKEFDTWRSQGVAVKTTVDRADEAWGGNVGVVTLLLDRLALSSAADTLLMTCGPEVMMWYTVQSALGRGLKAESIFVSLERNMNCAIGLCGHCQFGPEFLCKDGPVFQYDRVASILRMDDL